MTNQEESFNDSKKDDDQEEFAEYSPKSEFSKPKMVEVASLRCLDCRAKEIKAGYYNYKADDHGKLVKIWIPDTRKIYHASVRALRVLLTPEISKSEKHKTALKEIDKKEKELFNKFCYKEVEVQVVGGRLKYVVNDIQYIPEFDAEVIVRDPRLKNQGVRKSGGWNNKTSAYWHGMVELSDEIFEVLNGLIDTLNYFKSKPRI